MHGFLVVDKGQGLTSHAVVSRLRKLLQVRRIGHTGTLDPMATGVLPVAVGEATRLIPYLQENIKTYQATIRLGSATNTQDAEGEVVFTADASGINLQSIIAVIDSLSGEQEQLPPMFSAIKKNGVPLYKLARKGEDVQRERRRIHVFAWSVDAYHDEVIECTINCSRGTYVRTLAHDLGMKLGCGAHLTSLRRLRSGPFTIEQSISLEQVQQLLAECAPIPWVPLAEAFPERVSLSITEKAVARLLDGVPPEAQETLGPAPEEGAEVFLMYRDCLVAAARFAPQRAKEKRGDFEIERVFNQVREIL